MFRYLVRRILQLIPVLFGISFITFALSFIVPGDPVRAIMGQRSDREAELRIRQKFGLDKPWYIQYGIWVRNLVRNPGELPSLKLRSDLDEGSEVYELQLNGNSIFATDGILRKVSNEPFRRQVLTHLFQRGCDAPDNTSETDYFGGSTATVVAIDTDSEPSRMLLKDFQGIETWYDVDDGLEVCSDKGSGGIELAEQGSSYNFYYRTEGLHIGREFTAVFDEEVRTLIDGIYDESSIDTVEVRALGPAEHMTIIAKNQSGGAWHLDLKRSDGTSSAYEIMPNAVIMIGGNRSTIDDVKLGIDVNIALVEKAENNLVALFDHESENLDEIRKVVEANSGKIIVAGTITDLTITPAVWFDFGRSYRQQRDVREIIRGSFKNTAYLTLVAMFIAIAVGVFAGIVSAVKQYSILDYLTMAVALIGVSMPVFWLGLMLILLFQSQLGWITGTGFGEITYHSVNLGLFVLKIPWHQNIILPSVTLATVPMAIIARMTRSSMLEVMNLDYIRTARAKGLSEWRVIVRHALKNSLIPIITVIGVNFALLLAGAVLTETVFSWPGLGREIVDAIEFRDFPVVMAGVVLFAFVFVVVNLIVDLLYAYVDPRIRYQ